MDLMINFGDIVVVLGVVLLVVVGGEVFLCGVFGVVGWLCVFKLLIVIMFVVFVIFSLEFIVLFIVVLLGKLEIGLGDVFGSNVVNIVLIFGLVLLFGLIWVECCELGWDFGLVLIVLLLIFWLVVDSVIFFFEGGLLLLVFVGWMVVSLYVGVVVWLVVMLDDGLV